MDDHSNVAPFAMIGDADPVSAGLPFPLAEPDSTLLLLYDLSLEITSILDREELLRKVAHRVKKLVNYHMFSVMLWNESTQLLESVFGMRYGDSIPTRLSLPLNRGITGASAAERRPVR